jgi:hypothetical protein
LQGMANTATIRAIREKLISILSIRVRVPADDVAWWRTPITGGGLKRIGRATRRASDLGELARRCGLARE